MSTTNVVARYERLPLEWVRRTSISQLAEVTAIRTADADRNRIYQALTLPEYVDAWLVVPGAVARSTVVAIGEDGFLVTYRLAEGREERCFGFYKVLRRGKVQFAWRREGFDHSRTSLVRIQLQGDFGRTTVRLTHVGLDESERPHYKMLWDASLDRLAGLFRSPIS